MKIDAVLSEPKATRVHKRHVVTVSDKNPRLWIFLQRDVIR